MTADRTPQHPISPDDFLMTKAEQLRLHPEWTTADILRFHARWSMGELLTDEQIAQRLKDQELDTKLLKRQI